MDVTVNWRSHEIENNGVFYTDANGYKIMKRDINKKSEYPTDPKL